MSFLTQEAIAVCDTGHGRESYSLAFPSGIAGKSVLCGCSFLSVVETSPFHSSSDQFRTLQI